MEEEGHLGQDFVVIGIVMAEMIGMVVGMIGMAEIVMMETDLGMTDTDLQEIGEVMIGMSAEMILKEVCD